MNSLEQLLEFLSRLQDGRIQFDLKCVRDAITATVRSPSTYNEIEFFADGHIEVQTLGAPSLVRTLTLQEIAEHVASDLNG